MDYSLCPENYFEILSPIRISDKAMFELAYSHLKTPNSMQNFASAFLWGNPLNGLWAIIHYHLCVFVRLEGNTLAIFGEPLPINPSYSNNQNFHACLICCFEIMNHHNKQFLGITSSRIEYVSEENVHRFTQSPDHAFEIIRMTGDYIYDMQEMINLSGNKFHKKRAARNQFVRKFPNHHTEKLSHQHQETCLALLKIWAEHKDKSDQRDIITEGTDVKVLQHQEILAITSALEHYEALELTGMVLFVDDTLAGFTLGKRLGTKQALILIEKTHPHYPGAAQFIFSEFCRQYWGNYTECNKSEDLDIPNLRFTKESYHPIQVMNKYWVKQTSTASPANTGNQG